MKQIKSPTDEPGECRFCGNPATCYGKYEGNEGYACDECCGHGREDGWCDPIDGSGFDEPTDPPELILDADESEIVEVFAEVGRRIWPPDETPTPDAMPVPTELGGEGGKHGA